MEKIHVHAMQLRQAGAVPAVPALQKHDSSDSQL